MLLKTEKEKMLAGECYNCLDPDLEAERQKTKELLRLYNLSETVPERQTILQQLIGQIGQNSIIEPPFYCVYGQNISIGEHVYLNYLCTILDTNKVDIGNHVMIGPNVHTPGHWGPPMIEDAILGKPNTCQYGNPDSAGSWIYLSDAAKSAIDLLDAPKEKIQTMNYNVAGIPEVVSAKETEAYLRKRYPGFQVTYQADPVLVAMGSRRRMKSPVKVFSDSYARKEWGWQPNFTTLEAIVAQFEKDLKSNPRRYGLS